MLIIIYFLLICFINLCNSFTLINKKCFPIKNCRLKLKMGCDYYIDINLDIYNFNDKLISYINLEHEKGYFWFSSILDEDADGFEEEYAQYIKAILEQRMDPIVIYKNNAFLKLSFDNKYKTIIENHIKFYNMTLNDISKIIKTENRYERW